MNTEKIGWLANPEKFEKLNSDCSQIMERVDLLKKADIKVSEISHGESRQLEVAMALAMKPKMLLLDEPAAGISPTERGRLVELLKSLDSAITLILIEHDMAVALAVADEVIVMHDGEVFTKGTPEEIRKSSAVRDLYLGSNHE
jgi:branched-chain amino acid transport system ATP-binding protein